MAAKRFLDELGSDPDQPSEKRIRTRPSFASVIAEVVMVNSLQNLCSALEPVLRRVVNEEMERSLRQKFRTLTRSPSLRIQAPEPSSLQLVFTKSPSVPIFTNSKIKDTKNNPLRIILVDTGSGSMVPVTLPQPIKVEIVVLDGDFPRSDHHNWTSEEFENNILKERTGRRPLLTGELNVTLRDGVAPIGEIEFTDNSSWIRCRKFKIGARVVQGSFQGLNIREGMTEAFIVKDHRGELYKKHHPPMLEDEVWRLEKIGKEGAFHKKLASEGVNTVQDFLKLSVVDPAKLRRILGSGMSEKMWESTIKHARECVMGNKLYIFRGPSWVVILNPICQLVKAVINGHTFPAAEMTSMSRAYIESLVRQAYGQWHSLEEVEGVPNEIPLLTQGDMIDQYPNHPQTVARSYQQNEYPGERPVEVNYMQSNAHPCCEGWQVNTTYLNTPAEMGICFTMTGSSPDGDLTPPRSFINGS